MRKGKLALHALIKFAFGLTFVGALLFILSLQPYAATLLFVFFVIKVFLLVHRR